MKLLGYIDDGITFLINKNQSLFGDWWFLCFLIEICIALGVVAYIIHNFGDCCVD